MIWKGDETMSQFETNFALLSRNQNLSASFKWLRRNQCEWGYAVSLLSWKSNPQLISVLERLLFYHTAWCMLQCTYISTYKSESSFHGCKLDWFSLGWKFPRIRNLKFFSCKLNCKEGSSETMFIAPARTLIFQILFTTFRFDCLRAL